MSETDEIRERKLEELSDDGAPDAPTEPIPVNGAEELNRAAEEYDVVLADFYADWCGPCQMLEPVVETVAAETDAAVAKVDVDANQQLAGQYGVRGVPTMILFADGEPAERIVGVQNEGALRNTVESYC
jgi:thioredoxin 1